MKSPLLFSLILIAAFSFLNAPPVKAQEGPTFSTAKAQEIKMPEFDGDLTAFLMENLEYPEEAMEEKLTGRVVVKFTVTEEGKVKDCKVVKSVADVLDREALRVARNSSGKWIPGQIDGKARDTEFYLPVIFALQNQENTPADSKE